MDVARQIYNGRVTVTQSTTHDTLWEPLNFFCVALGRKEMAAPDAAFEYIDHPADIQIHSWGPTIERALEPLAIGLFGVMMDLDGFADAREKPISVKGNDLFSMVCSFLDQ